MARIIIIGAGIGGIATANLLAQAGHEVDVYEQLATPGGRAGEKYQDGFRFDTGPSWYLMPEVFYHYYRLLGESLEDHLSLTKLTPAYKVFFEQQPPLTITGSLETDEKTFETIESGAGQQLRRYVEAGDEAYKLALRSFLYTNFTDMREFLTLPIIRRVPQLLRLLRLSLDQYVKQFVQDQRLQQILEYPSVFLGASPYSSPALYSLMSALDFKEGVFYPEGGIYRIITSLHNLAVRRGVRFHFQEPVKQIEVIGGTVSGITLTDGTYHPADIVISNADLHYTETALLQSQYQSYPESYWQKREAGPSALLLYLGVKGSLDELEHHNLFFVDNWHDNFEAIFHTKETPHPASIYVSRVSKTDPTTTKPGYENLFVLVPLPAGKVYREEELGQLVDRYIEQIEQMAHLSIQSRIVSQSFFGPNDFSRVFHAWQSSMLGPSHILRQSALFRTPNKSKKVRGLYYVGASTLPGIGLPMCLISAELVVRRIEAGRDKIA